MRKLIFHIEFVLSLSYLLCEYLVGSVNDGSPQVNKFIEKLKLMIDSQERIDALKEFAARHEAEKEREINETIMAKEAEKERAVKAVELRMALGTFLCTLSYIHAVLEHIYRTEVEICNPWKRYRPTNIKSNDELNRLVKPRYFRWIGFMHENRSRHHIWKAVREQLPKKQYLDFAWSMPKMYYFCRDYMEGKRSHSLNEYVRLRAEGTKKTLLEFLYKHSQWFLTKKDVDFLNVLLRAAQYDEVGYEWLDRQAKLVIPYSSGDICLPPDKHFLVPNDTATYENFTRRRTNRTRKIPTGSMRTIVNLPVILDK